MKVILQPRIDGPFHRFVDTTPCCEAMKSAYDDGDVLVEEDEGDEHVYMPTPGWYGYTGALPIQFCPWCGAKIDVQVAEGPRQKFALYDAHAGNVFGDRDTAASLDHPWILGALGPGH